MQRGCRGGPPRARTMITYEVVARDMSPLVVVPDTQRFPHGALLGPVRKQAARVVVPADPAALAVHVGEVQDPVGGEASVGRACADVDRVAAASVLESRVGEQAAVGDAEVGDGRVGVDIIHRHVRGQFAHLNGEIHRTAPGGLSAGRIEGRDGSPAMLELVAGMS